MTDQVDRPVAVTSEPTSTGSGQLVNLVMPGEAPPLPDHAAVVARVAELESMMKYNFAALAGIARGYVAAVDGLAARVAAVEAELGIIRQEWSVTRQDLTKASNTSVATIDEQSAALQRTIDRVAVLENTIRGLGLHGGDPDPTGGPATMQ